MYRCIDGILKCIDGILNFLNDFNFQRILICICSKFNASSSSQIKDYKKQHIFQLKIPARF